MKSTILRAITFRAAAFFVAFAVALTVTVGYYVYAYRQTHFADAAMMGSLPRMKFLYALGVDVNAPGCRYRTCFNPICGAALSGRDDAVVFLLDRGADVNNRANYGLTPLMAAANNGHESTVRLLLARGADVNANRDDDTALSLALRRGHLMVANLLLQAGAEPSNGDDEVDSIDEWRLQ